MLDDIFKDIRSASFRGVPFGVLDASDSRGRNVVVHEFPLKDSIYVEDMGRSKRTISLTAFIIDPGMTAKRDALIAALEEAGPGTLIHPWLGSFYVNLVAQAEISHAANSVGYVTFKLQFAEAAEPEWPDMTIFWPDLATARGLLARAAAAVSLGLSFVLSPVADAALEIAHVWAQGLSGVLGAVFQSSVMFPYIVDTVAGFLSQVNKLGGIASLVEGFWPVRDYQNEEGPKYAYKEAVGLLTLALESPPYEISPTLGTVRRQMAVNKAAIVDYQREICGIAGLEAGARATPASAQEGKFLKELAMEATDFILNHATSDEVFRTAQSLGTAAQRALADAAKRAPQVVEVTDLLGGAALAIAWRRVLVDNVQKSPAATVEDLIRRNGIRHPGFVPSGVLEVLRD